MRILLITVVLICTANTVDAQFLGTLKKYRAFRKVELHHGVTSPLIFNETPDFNDATRIWSDAGRSYGIDYIGSFILNERFNVNSGFSFSVLSTNYRFILDETLHDFSEPFSKFSERMQTHSTWNVGYDIGLEWKKEYLSGNRIAVEFGGQLGMVVRSLQTHGFTMFYVEQNASYRIMESAYEMNEKNMPHLAFRTKFGYYQLLKNGRYMYYGVRGLLSWSKIIRGTHTLFVPNRDFNGTFHKRLDQLSLSMGMTF